jgi:hypothetical protein
LAVDRFDTPTGDDLRRGYRFWGFVISLILLIELAGAARGWLERHDFVTIPWTTISEMVGHLEDLWPGTAVFVVAIIAPVALYALGPLESERRSPLGRWHAGSPPGKRLYWYSAWFVLVISSAVGVLAVLIFEDDFVRAYFIYGTLFAVGIVIPSLLVLAFDREVGFPSLFVTISHVRRRHDWKAWLATTALAAGLAILVIHLAFYPWPDITKEPVEYAGLTATQARTRAVETVPPSFRYSTQARAVVNARETWTVFFIAADGSESSCVVNVTEHSLTRSGDCGS